MPQHRTNFRHEFRTIAGPVGGMWQCAVRLRERFGVLGIPDAHLELLKETENQLEQLLRYLQQQTDLEWEDPDEARAIGERASENWKDLRRQLLVQTNDILEKFAFREDEEVVLVLGIVERVKGGLTTVRGWHI